MTEFDQLRRRVLWSIPTGLFVVGSRHLDRRNLMTANLVVQVALEPKLVAAAIDVNALTHSLIAEGGCFSVNLLRREDRVVVRRFVKPVPEADITVDDDGQALSMAGEPVREQVTGAPILDRSAAWIDCSLRQQIDFGSHSLFVGEVEAVGPDDEIPPVLRLEDTLMHYGG